MRHLISVLLRVFALTSASILVACGSDGSTPQPTPLPIPSPIPTPTPPFTMSGVHAVTAYIQGQTFGHPELTTYLQAALPTIKSVGFNTIYMQPLWLDFDPSPMANPRAYNETMFANARATLDLLRANGMKAMMGLNYLGVGWAPDFSPVLTPDQACNWAVNPQTYAAFEQYVQQFFTEFDAYSDMLTVFVFTEGAEGCGMQTAAAAPAVAAQLQTTLGSMPTRLPAAMRAKWKIGYHDYSIINLGWGNGATPVANPNPFDFMSIGTYNAQTTTEFDARTGRMLVLYPNLPLIFGESGNSACPAPYTPDTQAQFNTLSVSYALSKGYGFNIWGWNNAGALECASPVYNGLSITNSDGSPNAGALAIKSLLN